MNRTFANSPRAALVCALACVCFAWAGPARADGPDAAAAAPAAAVVADAPRAPNAAISLPLPALQDAAGISATYERRTRARWSLAFRGGLRDAADGDYAAGAVSAGAQARYWITRRAIWSGWSAAARAPAMVGPYVGAGIDLSWTRTRDTVADRVIGSSIGIAPRVDVGYRFAPWRGLLITPTFGLAVVTDVDPGGRLSALTRGTITTGFELGWMF